ncbi:hypothetical protein HBI56_169020 [Parastagonospora nodorum]|nr:hypothetical protein HBI80_128090 [Parastagonospora nodorum]KAH5092946.1 hypothetical protein HBH72_181370 [Parastagonospora nodorum]KAH5202666.1 hypothetical protein HBH77_113340 [Parastagonospora nodorum]KAH5352795.1 hypothetical protein HBI49_177980 [Parastagonospora nodorum]KAH5534191.1 hypothetical protein HBI27_187970 [Parastagonospora nodorum]
MTSQLSSTDYPSSVVRLRDEIIEATIFCDFSGSEAGHVSGKTIRSVATEHNILQALNHEESLAGLADEVKRLAAKRLSISSPKLFLICLVLSVDLSFIWKRRGHEIDSRFTDDNLPFSSKTDIEPHEKSFFKSLILPYQPSVLCPAFVNGDFDLIVDNAASIPIKRHGTHFPRGGNGKVYEVSVHKDYLSLLDAAGNIDADDEGWSRKLAMKEISDDDAATREIKLVKALNAASMKPAHLLTSHTGFTMKSTMYLISELGDRDLNEMFSKTDPPEKNDAARKWYQDQFLGLAEAVKHIHDINPSMAGYIHDIKPANVVAFGKDRPTLKLIDWGCANVNPYIAGESSNKTGKHGDTCYMPPEATEKDIRRDGSVEKDDKEDGSTKDDGTKGDPVKEDDGKHDSVEEDGGRDDSAGENAEKKTIQAMRKTKNMATQRMRTTNEAHQRVSRNQKSIRGHTTYGPWRSVHRLHGLVHGRQGPIQCFRSG